MKIDSKDIFWKLLNVVLAVSVILGLVAVYALWRHSRSVVNERVISVSAESKTTVAPDIAVLSFSAVTEGTNVPRVTADNTKIVNAAIDFVKKNGIEAKDIKTIGYDLSPRYEYDEKKRTSFISGYTLTQTVRVKIRDFAKIGEILGGLPGQGINQIGSLAFEVEDPDRYLNEARSQAFEKARAKAQAMATQNGVRIKRVVSFFESSGGYPYPLQAYEAFGKGGGSGGFVPPTIEPGSQEVTIQVTVTYELR